MLKQPTLQGLARLKLHAMAAAFEQQCLSTAAQALAFEERFAMLVDAECLWRIGMRFSVKPRLPTPSWIGWSTPLTGWN